MNLVGRMRLQWVLIVVAVLAIIGLGRLVELVVGAVAGASGQSDGRIGTAAGLATILVLGALVFVPWARLWLRQRSDNRFFGANQAGGSYFRSMRRDVPIADEQRAVMDAKVAEARDWADVADFDANPLRRVIGIGQRAVTPEADLEVLSIEIRGRVAKLNMAVRDLTWREPDVRLGAFLPGRPMSPDMFPSMLSPVVEVADDTGTAYRVSQGGGGGGGHVFRSEILMTPVPPDAAHTLTITVSRLSDERMFAFGGQARTPRIIEGPWRFDVPLSPGSA